MPQRHQSILEWQAEGLVRRCSTSTRRIYKKTAGDIKLLDDRRLRQVIIGDIWNHRLTTISSRGTLILGPTVVLPSVSDCFSALWRTTLLALHSWIGSVTFWVSAHLCDILIVHWISVCTDFERTIPSQYSADGWETSLKGALWIKTTSLAENLKA